jgi:hypothetical protein
MRTRTKTTIVNQTSIPFVNAPYNIVDCNGNTTGTGNQPLAATSFNDDIISSTMVDVVGTGTVHPVIHRSKHSKVNLVTLTDRTHAYPGQRSITYTGGGPHVNEDHYNGLQSHGAFELNTSVPNWSLYPPAGWTIGALSPSQEASLREDCFEKANQLKADVVLNLVEANQAWPAVDSLINCLPEVAHNWKQIRKVIRTASGAFLAWKFGVSPILSDIESIQKYLPKMKDDIDRHVKGEKMRFSAIGKVTNSFSTLVSGGSNHSFTGNGRSIKPPIVRYVLVVKPNNTNYHSDFFKKADAVLSRFSTSPASLAWEKIPFSFVADWFVDVRGMCRALDGLLGIKPYKVIAFTRSFSYTLETDVVYRSFSFCGSNPTVYEALTGTHTFKHYERSLASTAATWPFWKPHFGQNQAALSAALIAQQLSKVVRKGR